MEQTEGIYLEFLLYLNFSPEATELETLNCRLAQKARPPNFQNEVSMSLGAVHQDGLAQEWLAKAQEHDVENQTHLCVRKLLYK